jgi:hypothetical protein
MSVDRTCWHNLLLSAAGGHWWTDQGKSYYANPAQPGPSQGCSDVAPDNRHTCEQQVCMHAYIAASQTS